MSIVKQILKVSPKDIEDVRKLFNKSAEDIKNDVQILKEWMAKNPHLPQNYDDVRIEKVLLRSKFRIEEGKTKLDNYFTLRGLNLDYLFNSKTTHEDLKIPRKQFTWVPIPELTQAKERIVVCKFNTSLDSIDIKLNYPIILGCSDLEFSHDYSASIRFLVDLDGITMKHLRSMDLNVLIKGSKLFEVAYGARVSGIDYLNSPKFIEVVLQISKMILKQKTYSRIKVHKDLESLYEAIDKRCLPSDYGGHLGSLKELREMTENMFDQELEFLKEQSRFVSNENLRIGKPYKNDYFGTDGTFKTLNLD